MDVDVTKFGAPGNARLTARPEKGALLVSHLLNQKQEQNRFIASGSAAIFCTFVSPYTKIASYLAMTAESLLCPSKHHLRLTGIFAPKQQIIS
jgi:hypothetical protein